MTDRELIEAIKAALDTEEDGENLVSVARNAREAELQFAASMHELREDL